MDPFPPENRADYPPEHENRHPMVAAAEEGHREWRDGGEMGVMSGIPKYFHAKLYILLWRGFLVHRILPPRDRSRTRVYGVGIPSPGVLNETATDRASPPGTVLPLTRAGGEEKTVSV